MRDEKGRFINGHQSAREKVKSLEIIEWQCIACGEKCSKTREQLHYRNTIPKYCSIGCVYKNNPRKGVVLSAETKRKLSVQKIGSNNPSWAGGVTPMRVALRNTPEYKTWRKKVFERDNYTCRYCGQRGGEIQADHITPFMIEKDRLLDLENGQTLCVQCHREKTKRELKENWVNQYTSKLQCN